MPHLVAHRPCGRPAADLLVMLPGAYSVPQDFVAEGLVDELTTRGLAADVLLADTHLGYYADRSALQRLHDDVIAPARAAGTTGGTIEGPSGGGSAPRVWLVGISLGGLIALAYTLRHPDQIAGAVLLSPYPGRRPLQAEIQAAGGPAAWLSQTPPVPDDDIDVQAWAGLAAPESTGHPPIYIGYGRDDRFAAGQAMMAATLPTSQVQVVAGGHDWDTWRALWRGWLDRGLLGPTCAP